MRRVVVSIGTDGTVSQGRSQAAFHGYSTVAQNPLPVENMSAMCTGSTAQTTNIKHTINSCCC